MGGCPVYPGVVPTAGFTAFNPGIAVFERNFKNPRTIQYSASIEREVFKNTSILFAYNYAKTTRLTRFVNRNDGGLYNFPFPNPFSPCFGLGIFCRENGSGVGEIRSTESSGKSLYQGFTFTFNKRFADRFQFQANYLLSWDKSDDDNERDPFTFRYADVNNFVAGI